MFMRLFVLAVVAVGGWVVGSLYPAPQTWLEHVTPQIIEARVRAVSDHALAVAADAGQVITVEHLSDADSAEQAETAPAPLLSVPGTPAVPDAAPMVVPTHEAFATALNKCPGMTVSNAPTTDARLKVTGYAPVVNVNGIAVAVDPTSQACLSSGFGPRSSRLHKGLDYHADSGTILAAADGTVIEMKYRDDYGNMLLIDHGKGVYTRYAHLSAFSKTLKVGTQVKAGDVVGLMGNTAAYPIPIHLHYELLTGDYKNPKASFGLTPANPFAYPAVKSAT